VGTKAKKALISPLGTIFGLPHITNVVEVSGCYWFISEVEKLFDKTPFAVYVELFNPLTH